MKYCIILIFVLCLIASASESESESEIGKDYYKPYECKIFKVGDIVIYSYYWVGLKKSDFVGVVTKIEPKPTNKYMHWITIKKLSGSGTSGVYSEQFLYKKETN